MPGQKESQLSKVDDLNGAILFCQKRDTDGNMKFFKYEVVQENHALVKFDSMRFEDIMEATFTYIRFVNRLDDSDGYYIFLDGVTISYISSAYNLLLVNSGIDEFSGVGVSSRAYYDNDGLLQNQNKFFVSKDVANQHGINNELDISEIVVLRHLVVDLTNEVYSRIRIKKL